MIEKDYFELNFSYLKFEILLQISLYFIFFLMVKIYICEICDLLHLRRTTNIILNKSHIFKNLLL